ncbi:hypothetical protein PMIN06_005723 [Paraphaeosphaeria minitans]|uniref:Ankyrin and het domain protein n=1 Tax=Paraphaeosphaeria minitans TaxID=565426 RepID=A0A9P6GD80_9PLEO|nr:ankyrin and het domain protein [Paraphaeosphaeria minitans]
MGSMNSRASNMLIWLGNDEGRRAVVAFEEIRRCANIYNLASGDGSFRKRSEDDVDRLDVDAWDAVKDFLANEWFTRVWVQQELDLNRNSSFHWGLKSIPANTVSDVTHWLWWNHAAGGSVVSKRFDGLNVRAFQTCWLAETFRPARTHVDFVRVMDTARQLLATDPRDYIYGFLGHPGAKIPSVGECYVEGIMEGEAFCRGPTTTMTLV